MACRPAGRLRSLGRQPPLDLSRLRVRSIRTLSLSTGRLKLSGMGFAKQQADEVSERGFASIAEQTVCLECIYDEGLRREIQALLSETHCTFCGTDSESEIAADLEEVMPLIMDAIWFFYGRADDEAVPYDEGEYIGAPIYNTWDVVDDICSYAMSDAVIEAIKEMLNDEVWTEADWMSDRPDSAMRYGWSAFRQKIQHEVRFVFFNRPAEPSFRHDEVTPEAFLKRLSNLLFSVDAVKTLPAGSKYWRGRLTDDPEVIWAAKDFGSPPKEKASGNRMSPAGIAMFYGSADVETVVAEIGAHNTKRYAIVGQFETVGDMTVVDLANLPPRPSIFERSGRDVHYDVSFMYDFVEELRRPVSMDGREHIEYVPTQVVTEYLRWMLIPDVEVGGVLFRSAQTDKTNCVIFTDSAGCVDGGVSNEQAIVRLANETVQVVRVMAQPVPL